MLYQKNLSPEISEELFADPGPEYRGTPFWSWNCRVTKKLIRDQIEVFHKMGFGGAHIHPRTGMETEYMSRRFLELVSYADSQFREKGMLCWLYDEDRYPSGTAGGLVTENWHYRARHLLLTREKKRGMCASGKEFYERVKKGEKPSGYYLCSYRIATENGLLKRYSVSFQPPPATDCVQKEVREGRLWFAYVEWMRESPWYNDQTYVDVMNKEAVECFLQNTHERYYRALGKEFGRSIPAIFTDEPQITGGMALSRGEADEDVTLPFTDDLSETYQEKYGVSLLEILPELLWEKQDAEPSVHRYRYYDHLTERFVSAYSDTIAQWCEKHGIALTGHYMSEPTLYSQTLRLGEAMRCYRRQQLPGIDILCGDPEYSTAKQAVSIARQMGREGVLCELYGVTHWDFDFKGHKLQGDWLAALGVTIRAHHLAFMSMEGEAKRDWPASISYQSPWWEKYSCIEDYFARLNTVLTRGRALVHVAVLHPIESYWLACGPVAETGEDRKQQDERFKNLIEWMLFGMMDFDFISEAVLPEEKPEILIRPDGRTALKVGQMEYTTVLIPPIKTIRGTTLQTLEEFARAGGRVIFMGRLPALLDAEKDAEGKIPGLVSRALEIPFEKLALEKALEEEREIEICYPDGGRSNDLFYQMREDNGKKWLFVCHVRRENDLTDKGRRVWVKLRGYYRIRNFDALTGRITDREAFCKNGKTWCGLTMYHEDSILWQLIPEEGPDPAGDTEASPNGCEEFPIPEGELKPYGLVSGSFEGIPSLWSLKEQLQRPQSVAFAEDNVLLLDRAKWRIDGGKWQPEEEILRLDNRIRAIVGYPLRQDAYTQPWRIRQAPREHMAELLYEIEADSRQAVEKIDLAMERPENAEIFWNGENVENRSGRWYVDTFIRRIALPPGRAGKNILLLRIPYGRKTNLENLYLLGRFGVHVQGTRAYITKRDLPVYFGDITGQGYPFYGGSVDYDMKFSLEREAETVIRVPHFRSPVLEVWLDGKSRGLIAFSPHALAVGECGAGVHRLRIRAYGNRFNTFGTLHNCNPEYKWYGPDSYRTVDGEWSEAWQLRPFGILSRVEIWTKEAGERQGHDKKHG